MRQRLPDLAEQFVRMFKERPYLVIREVRHYIVGNYAAPPAEVRSNVTARLAARAKVFVAVCEAWQLTANEARELYNSLSLQQQQALEFAIEMEIREELAFIRQNEPCATTS